MYLYPGYIKNSYNTTMKKTNILILKWVKDLNRLFSKAYVQVASKYMKRCLILFLIGEIQIRGTIRYHFKPPRMAAIKKAESNVLMRIQKNQNPHGLPVGCKKEQPNYQTVW